MTNTEQQTAKSPNIELVRRMVDCYCRMDAD